MTDDRFLADTNIIIHQLSGDERIEKLLQDSHVHISFITEIEILSYSGYTASDRKLIARQLKEFIRLGLRERVKEIAIELRAKYRLKLADAIIAAEAADLNIPLVTMDRDFKKLKDEITIYYLAPTAPAA